MLKTRKKSSSGSRHQDLILPKPPTKALWLLETIFIALAIFSLLSILAILYLAATNHQKAKDAVNNISSVINYNTQANNLKSISSSLGFELQIDSLYQDAEGTFTKDGSAIIERTPAIYTQNSYTTVNVYKKETDQINGVVSDDTLKATYLSLSTSDKNTIFSQLKEQYGQSLSELELAQKMYTPISGSNKKFNLLTTSEISINGYKYIKRSYEIINSGPLSYKTKQTDYITVQNSRPYKVTVFQNAGSDAKDLPAMENVLSTIKYFPINKPSSLSQKFGNPIRNNLLPTAFAQSGIVSKDPDIQVIAKNEPAVVRIASSYCPEFVLKLNNIEQLFSGGCSAGYGSGFIISPDGYVATNGHVLRSSAGEVLMTSFELRNMPIIRTYLDFLVKNKLITQATADEYYDRANANDTDAIKSIVGSLADSSLNDVQVKEINQKGYYAVQLSNETVDFNLNNLKAFDFSSNIVDAKLVDIDYDPYADVANDGFNSSDVGLLKITKQGNYPFNILGSIEELSQGSPLVVIGFPGAAENELVNKKISIPTPTKGTVSSIRTANGTNNKLIQSDVTIAKGNSGGPAYNSNGEVVGIATYGLFDTQSGGSQFNYMRDIQDLKDILSKNNISLSLGGNDTQNSWNQGLTNFSKAYYTSAITDFKRTKQIYPQHRLVDEFIAKAESAKAQGKEATNPTIYLIVGGLLILFIVPGVILYFVIKHHHKRRDIHKQYLENYDLTNSVEKKESPNLKDQTKIIRPIVSTVQRRSVDMLSHANEEQNNQ